MPEGDPTPTVDRTGALEADNKSLQLERSAHKDYIAKLEAEVKKHTDTKAADTSAADLVTAKAELAALQGIPCYLV